MDRVYPRVYPRVIDDLLDLRTFVLIRTILVPFLVKSVYSIQYFIEVLPLSESHKLLWFPVTPISFHPFLFSRGSKTEDFFFLSLLFMERNGVHNGRYRTTKRGRLPTYLTCKVNVVKILCYVRWYITSSLNLNPLDESWSRSKPGNSLWEKNQQKTETE